MSFNKLSKQEEDIIINKATEPPYSGAYDNFYSKGIYICKRCNNRLFSYEAKFKSNCGWPSFDDCFENSILEVQDKDGYRTEILCANCKGHLGHVFRGEGFTNKDTRHCVNSLSIKFIPQGEEIPEVIYE